MKKTITLSIFLILIFGFYWGLPLLESTRFFSGYHGRENHQLAYNFQLFDTKGNKVTLEKYRGKYVYIFFGYTNCGFVCPINMNELRKLSKEIKNDKAKFLFISIDPWRDNLYNLKDYILNYGNNFIALFAFRVKTIQEILKKYRAYADYSYFYSDTDKAYHLEHTGYIYLVDPKGFLRLVYTKRDIKAEEMYEDIKLLIKDEE